MNEKEMIKEMANDLYASANCSLTYESDYIYVSRDLYSAGYRKIPEGSVVLTEMQYNALLSKQSTVISIDEQLKKEFEYELKQARKETAKEILRKGEEFYKISYHKSNAIHRLAEWIKDTFGVGVEE